jgi:hypothetical protein
MDSSKDFKGFSTGRFLVTMQGMFPRTVLTDTIDSCRIAVMGLEKKDYKVFRINEDGYIQQCNLTGKVII